jgi:hypothetical protein
MEKDQLIRLGMELGQNHDHGAIHKILDVLDDVMSSLPEDLVLEEYLNRLRLYMDEREALGGGQKAYDDLRRVIVSGLMVTQSGIGHPQYRALSVAEIHAMLGYGYRAAFSRGKGIGRGDVELGTTRSPVPTERTAHVSIPKKRESPEGFKASGFEALAKLLEKQTKG